jgi:hypothetical protein
VPAFSLNRGKSAHVASTYMDEFAERHTREMIVRDAVGACIPSAGVGTCMTKKLLKHFLRTRGQVRRRKLRRLSDGIATKRQERRSPTRDPAVQRQRYQRLALARPCLF